MNHFELARAAVGKDDFKPNEKIELWVRYWRGQKPQKTLNDLIVIYDLMIKKILIVNMRISENEFDDCAQLGRVALLKTIPNYDPNRKILFYTYARQKIIGEVKRYFRDKVSVIRLPAWFQKAKENYEKGLMSETQFNRHDQSIQRALMDETLVFSYDEAIVDDDSEHLARQIVGQSDTRKEVVRKLMMEEICLKLGREDSEILLRILDDYRISEIARSMDLSVDFASRRLAKIREKLRKVLSKDDIIV